MAERISGGYVGPGNVGAGLDFQALLSQLSSFTGQSDLVTRQAQQVQAPTQDAIVQPRSSSLHDYNFSGEVAVEGDQGILGRGAEMLTGAMGPGAGFSAIQANRREQWRISMSDLDPNLPEGERYSHEQLDRVSFRMSDNLGQEYSYTLPNGNTRRVGGRGDREMTLADIRAGWYHPDPAVREDVRAQMRRHFREEAETQGAQVRVNDEFNAANENVGDIEFDLLLDTALRENATVDPDAQGQGGQQNPQDQRQEQGLVNETGSPNEEAVQDLGSAFAALLATGGAGNFLGNYNGRNNFGIGGNMSWSDLGGAVSLGGAAAAFSGLSALMPATSIAPGIHLPTMGTGALSIAVEGGARVLGAPGMAFRAREVRETMIQIQKDEYMISTIRNSSIPIEYLVMMIMSHVYDSADKRMRLKLEEIMVAEQLQRRREAREGIGNIFKGLVNFVTGGIGGAVVDGAQSVLNHLDGSLNGNMKSQTVLIQELQFMTQILKQLMELISNMSKNFHDMAMVPVRNLR